MIDYLTKYNLTEEDIKYIQKRFNKGILSNFELMNGNVMLILDYLIDIGVTNIKDLILNRPDILFKNLDELKDIISKFDLSLIVFVFNNDVGSLINFNI